MSKSIIRKTTAGLLTAVMILGVGLPTVEAAKGTRVSTPTANRPAQRPAQRPSGGNVNVDKGNIDNSNVRIGNDTNIDIDVDGGYGHPVRIPPAGYYDYDYYHHGYSDEQVAGAFIAGIVIGAILNDEPDNSSTVVIHETEYLYDGSNYYVAVYDGADVVYKVVEDPT